MRNTLLLAILPLVMGLVACSSTPPAPVIDRLPVSKTSKVDVPVAKKQTPTSRPAYKAGDWRPDTYTVKKGDNLFSIGLEHGYYYKDIAQNNNISPPYNIQVGQVLKLKSSKDAPIQPNSDGVEITPINTESNAIGTAPGTTIAINEPKGIREPYSEEALKKPLPAAKSIMGLPTTKTLVASTAEATNKPNVDSKSEIKPANESTEDIEWGWPTKGKVTASFNEASNKGLDIAGSTGQSVNAAAAGKVIYSGSDLRGYGKLVIIKHNSTYLSVYAHNNQILVKEGQQISAGQKIAEMGSTDSNSVKLHFEIRRLGKSVDPSKYLAAI
ncbi:MAG: peptidoglycan DD-metalloendopeptidase family protein [Methylotenera sp.]|nr:peptidoglycan DD-metalloendopeptidase family protein [Methylotenera sp.]